MKSTDPSLSDSFAPTCIAEDCTITYYTTSHIAHVTTEVTNRTWKLQIHVTPATSSRKRRVAQTQGLNLDPMGNPRLSCLRPE